MTPLTKLPNVPTMIVLGLSALVLSLWTIWIIVSLLTDPAHLFDVLI